MIISCTQYPPVSFFKALSAKPIFVWDLAFIIMSVFVHMLRKIASQQFFSKYLLNIYCIMAFT